MKTSALSVLLYVLVASASSTVDTKGSEHQEKIDEQFRHQSYLTDFLCGPPQPRVIKVQELLSEYQTYGKAHSPQVTVLHVCDEHAGCCEGSKTCGPLQAEEVLLPFQVTFLEDLGLHRRGEWRIDSYSFVNHTACGCKPIVRKMSPGQDHHNFKNVSRNQVDESHTSPHHSENSHPHQNQDPFLEKKPHSSPEPHKSSYSGKKL